MKMAMAVMLALAGATCLAGEFTERRTSLPFTYVLDYDGDHLGNPKYIEQVRMGPPYLLHLGTDTPCHSYFGAAFDGGRMRAALEKIIEEVQGHALFSNCCTENEANLAGGDFCIVNLIAIWAKEAGL